MPKCTADFAEFALDLYLHSNETPVDVKELDKLEPSSFMDRAVQVLDLFALGHCTKFDRVLKKTLPEGMKTEADFLRFAIPKCLKLFDEERYFFSLMLVVGFLAELVEYLHDRRGCYLFAQTAYKCLVAVFKRRFKEAFDENGGFGGLDDYISSVLSDFTGDKKFGSLITILNGGDKDLMKRVADLIRNCHDPEDVDFVLNDYELSLVSDIQATKKEWFDPDVVDDFPVELDKSISTKNADLKPVYEAKKTRSESSCDDSDDYLDSISLPFTDDVSDSDYETSGSESYEPELENIMESVAVNRLRLEKPDLYDMKMSAVQCLFCGEKCYQYAKYILGKHCRLVLTERTSKVKLVLRRLASKVKIFKRFNISWNCTAI